MFKRQSHVVIIRFCNRTLPQLALVVRIELVYWVRVSSRLEATFSRHFSRWMQLQQWPDTHVTVFVFQAFVLEWSVPAILAAAQLSGQQLRIHPFLAFECLLVQVWTFCDNKICWDYIWNIEPLICPLKRAQILFSIPPKAYLQVVSNCRRHRRKAKRFSGKFRCTLSSPITNQVPGIWTWWVLSLILSLTPFFFGCWSWANLLFNRLWNWRASLDL